MKRVSRVKLNNFLEKYGVLSYPNYPTIVYKDGKYYERSYGELKLIRKCDANYILKCIWYTINKEGYKVLKT